MIRVAMVSILVGLPALAFAQDAGVEAEEGAPLDGEPLGPMDGESLGPMDDEPLGPMDDEPLGPMDDEPLGPMDDEPLGPMDDEPLTDDQPDPTEDTPGESAPATPPPPAAASEPPRRDGAWQLDTVSIVGKPEARGRVSGSAHRLGEEALETFDHDDVHRVLGRVPGVYVRDEEGFGLRPNIGLRGASSDRSAKVTLMEDGVLIAPAPYSAPAAYYFPMSTRMKAIEVFKGPSATRYGPNTVGGAVNFVSRDVPLRSSGALDLGIGEYGSGKAHGWWGASAGNIGMLLEAVHLQSDGFKEIDGQPDGGDTGFEKNELLLKVRWRGDPMAWAYHQADLKLLYADELSNETYLGLTDDDFDANPFRRYAASALGRMEWQRTAVSLTYSLALGDDIELVTTGYRHDFARDWRKLNDFGGSSPGLAEILRNPASARNAPRVDILRGDADSTTDDETLLIGTNDRRYVSQGIQTSGEWSWDGGEWFGSTLDFGLRLHHDRIERFHTEGGFSMLNGALVPDGRGTRVTTENRGETVAVAAHLNDELRIGRRFFLTPGARLEHIRSEIFDRATETSLQKDTTIVLPGLGAWYSITDWLGALAGVHRGFSPAPAGQDVDPETSINYEGGFRAQHESTRAEVVGYFSDYENLTAQCTISGTSCPDGSLGSQFDGGDAHVYGVETVAGTRSPGFWGVHVDVEISYTLTLSEFQTDFDSTNPLWGDVQAGDALPYVPVHQGAFVFGIDGGRWNLATTTTFTGEQRDVAGSGDVADVDRIPARTIVDLAAHWWFTDANKAYLKIDNLTDQQYIASKRPFGARPGKPLQVFVGYEHRFGGATRDE
jgi:Fe(3+) dicitrate transport protein